MADYVTLSQLMNAEEVPTKLDVAGLSIPATYRPAAIPSTAYDLSRRIRAVTTEAAAADILDECAHIVVDVVTSWNLREDGDPKTPGKPGPVIPLEYARVRRFPAAMLFGLVVAIIQAPALKKTTPRGLSKDSRPTTSNRTAPSLKASGLKPKASRTGSTNSPLPKRPTSRRTGS